MKPVSLFYHFRRDIVSIRDTGTDPTYKASAKRLQHANATYRNIVGGNILRAFGHHVATCWVLLAQV